MTDFCGDTTCATRIQIFLITPDDDWITEPCPQCVRALAELMHANGAATMREVHAAVTVGQL